MKNGAGQRDLALFRLKQAEESLDEAKLLFEAGKSARAVINRSYYAMFYAILGLLIFEPYSSSKHSGVLSYFNRRFVKSGAVPERLGRAVNKAFDLRLRSDYREKVNLTHEEAEPYLAYAQEFIEAVRSYLEKGERI